MSLILTYIFFMLKEHHGHMMSLILTIIYFFSMLKQHPGHMMSLILTIIFFYHTLKFGHTIMLLNAKMQYLQYTILMHTLALV